MDEAVLPFGMTWDREAFRIARALTKAVFDSLDATIILVRGKRVWRSIDPEGRLPQRDRAGSWVIEGGEALWFEDVTLDPRLADGPMVVGPPYIRFYAAAPIILSDGAVLGALCVVDDKPRPRNERQLARLKDLAKILANDCDAARRDMELAEGGRKLRNAQSVLSALIEKVPVSIMMTDKDLNLIEASNQWLKSVGHTRESAIGRHLYEAVPGIDRHDEAYRRCLAGETRRFDGLKWKRPDGADRYLKSELSPWRNAEGEICGIINVLLDITDLYVALRRAEEAEKRMTLAASIANLIVWELDYENRRFTFGDGSPEAQIAIYGREYSFSELARDTDITIHPADREATSAAWAAALAEGRPFTPEYRINRTDKEVWVTSGLEVIRDENGKALRMIGAMQDITERKKAQMALVQAKEDAEAANVAKSAFLATMSHEIRTPLNGVLGMAQALEAETADPAQREKLSIIRQSGESLLAVLNDVLDISKIEAGKVELEEAAFDIDEVARGACATFTELANRKGLEFNLTVAPEARGAYVGDSTRVRQVLYNLVSNAVKFTQEGEVLVMVGRSNEGLALCVSDTGIGVAPERLEKLFDKFEQADASTTRKFGGTGLGLSISRQLIELMGGAISVSSDVGRGTTFEVRLPLRWLGQIDTSTRPSPSGPEPEAVDAANLRVLAAEDNEVNRLVLRTLLAQAGIEATIVDNGALAVDAWKKADWDVILMDVQMPEMDGPTATRAIRAAERAGGRRHTPIIALTANAMSHQVAEYRACGMDDFVAKPIEIGQLFSVIERCVAGESREETRRAS